MTVEYQLLLAAALLLVVTSQLGNQPVPKCKTGFFYRTLPLIADEASIINLDHLFDGYNLQYTLEGHEDFKQYITLGEKLVQQGRQIPDVPLIGLKNYHIEKKGNTWGSTFIALTERSQRTFVHYGVINSNKSAPVVNNYISVENNTNTTCYDAVVFPAKDLILVDCLVKLKTPNKRGQLLQNTFYYFKISDGSFIRNVKTQMYVDFESIQRRSLYLYSDLRNSHSFLLRTYFYDGLKQQHRDNTYVQVFMITDPQDPWIVEVIDRAFLNAAVLEIADIRIYQGEIYILDRKMGVYRVFINTEQDLKLKGFYEVKGFEKFSVFSNNLDNHLEIALANSHSVYEIDWTNKDDPRLINKYSLMPDSKVSQVFLNQRFVFVQSQSKDDTNTYNYTWIMNRGDRTYSKAFKVIKHDTSKTIIDLNEDQSYLIVFDDQKLVNYKLDDSNMVIKLKKNQDLLDTINSFKVIATSKDQTDNSTSVTCQVIVNFTLLEDNNRTMWPIGDAPPSKYTANYPGKVMIKLHEYVLGPNVTYRIKEVDKDVIKKQKVYMQEQLEIQWEDEPPFDNRTMTFLETQTFNNINRDKDLMLIYMQDEENVTYIIKCTPDHKKDVVYCNQTAQHQFDGQINSWGTGYFFNNQEFKFDHIVSYTTKKHYNRINLIFNTDKATHQQIQLEKAFAGNATSIAVSNKVMYVVLKYVKNVQIYDLQLLSYGIDEPMCQLTHLKMYQLGIKYFSPTQVRTSVFHPNIVFIKTAVQIIVVDYNRQCVPKLLGIINPVQSAQLQFLFKVNSNSMIVTIPSQNLIVQYDIRRMQLGEIQLTKPYPRYGYKIPKLYDMDVSDKGDTIYATMVNQGGDYQIFVYRSGYPAVATLYDVIDLYSFGHIMIDATGFQIDYVTVYSNDQLRIFREYEEPMGEVFNPNVSYSFYLQYFNPSTRSNLEMIDVTIINLPTFIKVNPFLKDIMNTKDLLFSGENIVNEIDDSNWWQGNVLRIIPDCRDCSDGNDSVIKVNNHIQEEYTQKLVPFMSQYAWSYRGGSIQSANCLINMRHNGTIQQFVKLPFKQAEFCFTLAVGYRSEYQVSGCMTEEAINLYLTSFISEKGFAFEPFETTAENLLKLEAVNDLIILVDVQDNPYEKLRQGGIYFYAVNFDDQIPSGLMQIEYFDGQDLGMDELGKIYINNADLTYHQQTQTYRLYFTQMTRGVFIVDFKYETGATYLSIRTITHLPIQDMLTELKHQMPYDATYQAVAMISSEYQATLKKTIETVLLTTGKFHTIQMKLDFDMGGNLVLNRISRLYLRYAFYDIQNYIKHHNGLFVISQILPTDFDIENRSKQLLTIYSTLDKKKEQKVQERGFLGAFKINDTQLHNFDFNLTYQNDGHQQPRLGMVLIENMKNTVQKFTVHHNMSVVTKKMVDTQIIYIDLTNDFSLQKIRILMNGYSPYPEWKLIIIILFSIIGLLILIAAVMLGIKKLKQRNGGQGYDEQNQDYQNKESLISGGSNDRRSIIQPSIRDSVPEERSSRNINKSVQDSSEDRSSRKQYKKEEPSRNYGSSRNKVVEEDDIEPYSSRDRGSSRNYASRNYDQYDYNSSRGQSDRNRGKTNGRTYGNYGDDNEDSNTYSSRR